MESRIPIQGLEFDRSILPCLKFTNCKKKTRMTTTLSSEAQKKTRINNQTKLFIRQIFSCNKKKKEYAIISTY